MLWRSMTVPLVLAPANRGTPGRVIGVELASSRRRSGLSGSGLMCLRAVAPPDLAFYAVSVETLTFLFTDIEGSTALLRRLGDDGYAQVLAGHHALIRSSLAAHGGREVDTQGDAFFAVFSSPRACVAAVLQMQQSINAYPCP